MNYKNGIYLSIDGDKAIRVTIENNVKIKTDEIKISEELLGELEYNMSEYETVVEEIRKSAEPLDGVGAYSQEQLERVFNTAFALADAIRENDLTASILLKSELNELPQRNDDGTAMFLLTMLNCIIRTLEQPLRMKYVLYKFFKARSKFDSPDQWIEQCVLPDRTFFSREYSCEIITTNLFSGKAELSQIFFFDNYSDFFVFLFLKFVEQKKRILECPCCGKLFIPKSNRAEVYCDRIIHNGKTCKQLAPKLMQKHKQMRDTMFEKYELARNRNYKRVERYENAAENSSVKKLTFNQYKSWLDRASEAKRLYQMGELSAEEFERVIAELD